MLDASPGWTPRRARTAQPPDGELRCMPYDRLRHGIAVVGPLCHRGHLGDLA
jgi:hypothetical protein